MVYTPRTADGLYERLRESLEGKIAALSNFLPTSFNYVWTRAFAERLREDEVALLASQLSGYIEYAGGPVSQEDLDSLGVNDISPDEINQYMNDEDLDELVKLVGVERSPGDFAEGTVEITTVSAFTTIPEGTRFGTEPDSEGDFFEYKTLEEVSTESGETKETVTIQAVEEGSEYNVGSGDVTYLVNPPSGVNSVTNTTQIGGGVDEETNDELRERAQNAIFNQTGGGTAEGVRGVILDVDNVSTVSVKEYPAGNSSTGFEYEGPGGPGGSSADTPFADVIVEGGDATKLEDAIARARPVAIQHNLVRPIFVSLNVTAELQGSNIDREAVSDSVEEFVAELGLADNVVRDKIIQRIMNSDSNIEGINTLTISVDNEQVFYDSDNSSGEAPNHPLYKLRKGDSMEADGITEVIATVGGSSTELVEGTDYDEGTIDGSSPDAIDFGVGGDNPDEDTEAEVTYNISDDLPIDEYEKAQPSSTTITVA
jgi:uncharacterized phage protein gp47/JayE